MVAGIGAPGLVAAAVVGLTTAVTLLAFGWRQGIPDTLRHMGVRNLLLLGVVEAANVGLYYYLAQTIGPPRSVTAVHLTAPVLLVGWGVLRRRERLSPWLLVCLPTLVAALAALALTRPAGGHDQADTTVALLLWLASAACIGAFVSLAARTANGGGSAAARGGLPMLVSGTLAAAALPVAARFGDQLVSLADLWQLTLVGLLLFAPAVAAYRVAMRELRPVTATTIQPGEPFAGAVVLFGVGLSAANAVAALLVLASVASEVGHRRRQQAPVTTSRKEAP